jgi:PAS domain S-box-containing protein
MDLKIQTISQLCRQRLESSMASRFTAVEALASLFAIHPDATADEFAEFAGRLLMSHPPIRALQYADAQTRVTYVYPPKGNEITIREPMVLLTDPDRGPYVRKAINLKSATVHGPFDLRQGGKGIVVRTPIFRGDVFAGLAIGVYDVPALLSEALEGIQLERVHLNLSDSDGKSFFKQGTDSIRSHKRSIGVVDTCWTLSTGWSPGYADPSLTYRMLIWSSGVAFLIAVFFLFNWERTQTRRLETMVKERTADLQAQIDERRHAEAMLQTSESRFRELFDEAPLMYIITRDKNGRPIIKDANKSFMRTLQYGVHEIINQPLEKFYTEDSARKLMQRDAYPRVMKGETISGERSLIAKDGSTIHTLLRSRPEMDESGAVIGTRATFLDITDRKQADKEKKVLENKLRHARKMESIGTLAGGIAHDFNNILASIVGYAELVLTDCKPGSLMEENLNEIYIASLRARDLVKQILAFARQTNDETKPVAVHVVVKEVLKLIRSTIPATIEIENRSGATRWSWETPPKSIRLF